MSVASRLIDVAKLAGVSTSTVSYVLSGNRPISDATRQRVEQAIKDLGFRPHAGARSIRRPSLRVIAMVLPMVAEAQYAILMHFVLAVFKAARERGANVLLLSAEDGVEEITRVIASAQVDGMIATEVQERDERIPLLSAMSQPVVLIGSPPNPDDMVHVDLDLRASVALCFDHLYELGHRHIGYLGHAASVLESGMSYEQRALSGVIDAMESKGLPKVWSSMESEEFGANAALDSLFEQDPLLTGLIVYNERMLPRVLTRLKQLELDIPGDMSIVAICPEVDALRTEPRMTYIPLPVADLARLAFERLAAMIDGEDSPTETLLTPRMMPGLSTRALSA
jgi:DNA-binding LacI/PurR family transcriptional regulator